MEIVRGRTSYNGKMRRYTYIIIAVVIYCLFNNLSEASSDFELKGTVFTRSLKPIAIIKDTKTG